ncbi:MAG: hypothetical protein QM579_09105 [Desulfovibrio sp.]|uniref:hypothetical protein n=1 Tax=Desulfovibrio sp. TaxID=885 RepID=UPI0039E70E75
MKNRLWPLRCSRAKGGFAFYKKRKQDVKKWTVAAEPDWKARAAAARRASAIWLVLLLCSAGHICHLKTILEQISFENAHSQRLKHARCGI